MPYYAEKKPDSGRWFLFSYDRIRSVAEASSREEFELRLSSLGLSVDSAPRGRNCGGNCEYYDVEED